MTFRKFAYTTAFILFFFQISVLWSERTEATDLYIAVDTSLSIEESRLQPSLRQWLTNELTELLIPGDRVRLYFFYGQNDFIFSAEIGDASSLNKIREAAETLVFNRNYSDIGNAINSLRWDVYHQADAKRRPILFVLTDLIQEAPPGSRYQGMDAVFAEEVLSDARKQQREGWYIVTAAPSRYDTTIAEQSRKLYALMTNGGPRRTPDAPSQDSQVLFIKLQEG
ncbi:MAG: VWA domain-containing protein [Spirochaetaceae bacterium]|jgi:hypothetical protein|nr:VWA domain-containing protein [Spirochaetaceae bacterium]